MTNTSLIFDIGCHEGQDSDFYLHKGFTVVAVEANPVLCIQLKQRFSQEIKDGRFTLVEKAIADQEGHVEFFVDPKSTIWGTIRSDLAGAASDKIIVPAIKFSSLISEYGVPYYLKIDIEGADLLCLQGLLPFRDRPQFLSTECAQSSLRELWAQLRLLRKLGYGKLQIINQRDVPNQIAPDPAKEGCYFDQRFVLGASGLFGNELPYVWSSNVRAAATFSMIYMRNKFMGLLKKVPITNNFASKALGSWYDTHAMQGTRE